MQDKPQGQWTTYVIASILQSIAQAWPKLSGLLRQSSGKRDTLETLIVCRQIEFTATLWKLDARPHHFHYSGIVIDLWPGLYPPWEQWQVALPRLLPDLAAEATEIQMAFPIIDRPSIGSICL